MPCHSLATHEFFSFCSFLSLLCFTDHPKEARIPLVLIDGLVVYGLHRWEGQLKKEKAELAEKDSKQHETEKKATRAEKAASRNQTKATQKRQKGAPNNNIAFAPKMKIMQPDKNKKMH
jgi:hypothetical protein